MLLPLLENWPAKSKIITEICTQIQNYHATAWALKTLNDDPHQDLFIPVALPYSV